MTTLSMPSKGRSYEEIFHEMDRSRASDVDWRGMKTWSLVYNPGDEAIRVMQDAYSMFIAASALNPMAFPSVQKFENEVIAMTADLFHAGPEAVGNITTGGTESILLPVKAARDMACEKGIDRRGMEILMPETGHPAFLKACDYFDLKPVFIPLREDLRADPDAAKKLVSDKTVLMVGSAPCYPYGVVDPITELAAIAAERNIPFHVDSCVGGFILPFIKELGYDVPDFDFRVPGVTSISADLHKYGYTAKGASTVIYRNKELRKYQFYAYADWRGGVYASPNMTGTRSAAVMASCWALINFLGREGYLKMAKASMETTKRLIDGISGIPGLKILGKPDASLIAFAAEKINIFMVGEVMEKRGWMVDRIQNPDALHLIVTSSHGRIVDPFLKDLDEAVEEITSRGEAPPEGMAALYGLVGTLPDRKKAKNIILDYINDVYRYKG